MHAGDDWIDSLPAELTSQRQALRALLAHCEATPIVASFSIGCSLGRGVADVLSDVDAVIGVQSPRGRLGADAVTAVYEATVALLSQFGPLVDALRGESTGEEFYLRRVFAQYADGLQLDLAVVAEPEVRRGDAAPDFVELYRSAPDPDPETEGVLDPQTDSDEASAGHPSALETTADQLVGWAFLGWRALLDADKYLRRGSVWEAHQRLHETRDQIWKIWAAAHGAWYPWHGLSQVLDHHPHLLPDRIEDTVAPLDVDALRHALLAAADALDQVTTAAETRSGTRLRPPIAGYARRRLLAPADRIAHVNHAGGAR